MRLVFVCQLVNYSISMSQYFIGRADRRGVHLNKLGMLLGASLFAVCLTSTLYAQPTFTFDQRTKGVITSGNWKVGKLVTVKISNFGSTGLTYKISYKAEERVNESGLTIFREQAGALDPRFSITGAGEYSYLSLPIENKDYSIITVEEYEGNNLRDKQAYTFRNQGGIKFDVSTGFFVTGLKDESYIIKSDSALNKGIITKEASGDIRVGLGVLAHLHSRLKGVFNVGVAGGFELDNDAKVGYIAGGSLFIGQDQKFVLSSGVVFGKRATISNAYSEGQIVDLSLSVIPTVDIWDESWFVSLTYNF